MKPSEYDPFFLHSRREALVIFLIWIAALLWAIPYCYIHGYVEQFDAATFSTVFGIPSWLFWGIAVPWLVADLVTVVMCFGFIRDGDMGEEPEEDNE